MTGWLWSGLGIKEWLLSESVQVVFSFLLVGALLTPGVGWVKRFYRDAINPYSPGGAGDVTAPNGEVMHRYLANSPGGDELRQRTAC